MTVDAVLRFLPAATVVLLAAVALVAARGRRWWLAGVFVCSLMAIAGAAWQRQQIDRRTGELSARLAEIGGKPAPAQPNPTATTEAAERMLAADAAHIAQLQKRLARLQQAEHDRTIAEATAKQLAADLRQAGHFAVIVSCPPDDVEAFDYANQLVTILEDGGWDARGPEVTRIFGEAPSMRVALYANGPQQPQAAQILAGAFRKFDIPYESRMAPSDTVPAPGEVELYVPPKSAAAAATSGASSAPR